MLKHGEVIGFEQDSRAIVLSRWYADVRGEDLVLPINRLGKAHAQWFVSEQSSTPPGMSGLMMLLFRVFMFDEQKLVGTQFAFDEDDVARLLPRPVGQSDSRSRAVDSVRGPVLRKIGGPAA